ncbi:MAG: outer membrane beta-barrel protein [Bacteroidetes bacterium]|nr:outer membrane beta-barrel protein [Bacteroidota bacterium]
MKRYFTLLPFIAVGMLLLGASSTAQYRVGSHTLGINATVVTEPVGWGVNYEFGFDEHIGLGGVIRYWGSERGPFPIGSQTRVVINRSVIMSMFQASYHFLPKERFDPYGGLRLGYTVFDETAEIIEGFSPYTEPKELPESGISMSLMTGFRYFLSPKISIDGTLEYFLVNDEAYFDNDSDTGLMFSVNFTLD